MNIGTLIILGIFLIGIVNWIFESRKNSKTAKLNREMDEKHLDRLKTYNESPNKPFTTKIQEFTDYN
jgi:hypothetical protein